MSLTLRFDEKVEAFETGCEDIDSSFLFVINTLEWSSYGKLLSIEFFDVTVERLMSEGTTTFFLLSPDPLPWK